MFIDDIVTNKNFDGREGTKPTLSLEHGAMNGFMPRFGGINGQSYDEWVASTPWADTQIIAIPLSAPGFFDLSGVADPTTARQLKKLWADVFSVHCKAITGLNSTLSMDTGEIQVGHSESIFLEEDIKVKRERSQLSYSFDEKLNKVIGAFLDFLILNTAGHEHTQTPLIASNPDFRKEMKGRIFGANMKSGTILYVKLDNIKVNVIEAWLGGNIRNKKGGTSEGKMDITASKEILSYDVDMTGFFEYGSYIDRYAQSIVDLSTIFNKNPEKDLGVWVNEDEVKTMVDAEGNSGAGYNSGLNL